MVPIATDILQMATVIPNAMLTLSFLLNFFPIFKGTFLFKIGMKEAHDKKMSRATLTALTVCSTIYLCVGNMGYCLFGKNIQGNFLLSFRREEINEILYLFMNIGFLVSVFFSFPVVFFAARNNLIAVIQDILSIICKK